MLIVDSIKPVFLKIVCFIAILFLLAQPSTAPDSSAKNKLTFQVEAYTMFSNLSRTSGVGIRSMPRWTRKKYSATLSWAKGNIFEMDWGKLPFSANIISMNGNGSKQAVGQIRAIAGLQCYKRGLLQGIREDLFLFSC